MERNKIPKYLKKKKLYVIAKSLIKEEIPPCKDCNYSFYRGSERLSCGNYKLSSLACGAWVHIERWYFDEKTQDFAYDEEIFSELWDGRYHYHSINGEPVEMAV